MSDTGQPFNARQEAMLTSVASMMFPHPGLDEFPYRRVIAAIAAEATTDVALGDLLRAGIDELAPWCVLLSSCTSLESKARQRGIEETQFFRVLRSLVAHYLYDDPQVRAYIGYPGPSYSSGGYVDRGFNDLQWLPEPRIDESPEPLVEIGPLPYRLEA